MSALRETVAQAGSLLYRRLKICEPNIFAPRRLPVGDTADFQSALHDFIS